MLERIDGLPKNVFGLSAKGKVSMADYGHVVVPYFEEVRHEGRRTRLLYSFGPEFDGYAGAAVWEDLRIALRYMRILERVAVVTNIEWVRTMSQAMDMMMPCQVRTFENAAWKDSVRWITSPPDVWFGTAH